MGNMHFNNKHIEELKKILGKENIYLILLFGSYANGTASVDSDIDVLVVTKDDYLPKNFEEHTNIYLQISRKIRHIKMEVPIDLVVHTLPMYKKFIEQENAFSKEIIANGKIIYKNELD